MRMGWIWQSVKLANRTYGFISRFVKGHGFEIVTFDFWTRFTIVETVKKQVTLRFKRYFTCLMSQLDSPDL